MQAVCRGIEADIGGDRPGREPRVERLEIGALMNEAALGERLQEFGFRGVHRLSPWGLAKAAARRPDHQMKMPPESGGIERLVATERSRPMGTA